MLDVNMIIANNIQAELKKENKKQVDLAEGIRVSKQTMSKIMNGARAINAIELHKISEYLHVSIVNMSEIYFTMADETVYAAESYSEKIAIKIRTIELLSALDMLILVILVIMQTLKAMQMAM